MRKLASIRRVRKITPIMGADMVVSAQIDGWNCVVGKDSFKEGDFGVYFEIDSFIPLKKEQNRYSFLESIAFEYQGIFGARIRTRHIKGVLSQGLFLPLNLFPEIPSPYEGLDVTDLLNIVKWEPPIPAKIAGEVVGAMPNFIRKTDEERIQNLIDKIPTEIVGFEFMPTIKLDGTSMTVFSHEGRNGVCGRNWELRESEGNTLWNVAKRNNLIGTLSIFCKENHMSLALQGELIGEGIQSNPEKIKGQEFYLFKIWDIKGQCFLDNRSKLEVVNALLEAGAKLKLVPSLPPVLFKEGVTVGDILDMANGQSLFAKQREGLVFQRLDGKFSFKAISNRYLEKNQQS